jgi:hypothetical protein
MTSDVYHADPVPGGSLSSSGAKLLLPPSCPARYRYERDHPPPPKPEYDVGHAAHHLVLGDDGPDVVVIDAEDWRTKAARDQRDAAHAAGATPLLRADYERVRAMAAALLEHRIAAALFRPGHGAPERSMFWTDARTGVWRRARVDWLPDPGNSRLVIPDYKTTVSAAPEAIQRAIYNFGYHVQAAWYLDAAAALGLDVDAVFVFVFQEKVPPYLVTVAQPDTAALRVGYDLGRRAIDTYRECVALDRWPGYSDDVELIGLPAWAQARALREGELAW